MTILVLLQVQQSLCNYINDDDKKWGISVSIPRGQAASSHAAADPRCSSSTDQPLDWAVAVPGVVYLQGSCGARTRLDAAPRFRFPSAHWASLLRVTCTCRRTPCWRRPLRPVYLPAPAAAERVRRLASQWRSGVATCRFDHPAHPKHNYLAIIHTCILASHAWATIIHQYFSPQAAHKPIHPNCLYELSDFFWICYDHRFLSFLLNTLWWSRAVDYAGGRSEDKYFYDYVRSSLSHFKYTLALVHQFFQLHLYPARIWQ